jgi:hypothetical protein
MQCAQTSRRHSSSCQLDLLWHWPLDAHHEPCLDSHATPLSFRAPCIRRCPVSHSFSSARIGHT